MEYTSPGAALSQGLQSGLALAQNSQKLRQERAQHELETQLKIAEQGMRLVDNKNVDESIRIKAFNEGVRPAYAKLGLNLPPITPKTLETKPFQEWAHKSTSVIDDMQSKKIDPKIGMNSIIKGGNDLTAKIEALTEPQKLQRQLIIDTAQKYGDQADKAGARATDNTPTPSEAIKRQTELQMQLANLNKNDMNSQITAQAMNKAGFNVDPGKVTPEMVEMVKAGVRKELSFLNKYIPDDEYRHKEGISMDEARKLKAKGFTTDRMSRDFFVTDAPDGMDPLAMRAKGIKTMPMMPGAGGGAPPGPVPPPMPPGAAAPAPGGRPVTPPPLAPPAPMAAPPPAPTPTAGPMSLSGGAVKSTQSGPLQLQNQSLQ